MRCEQLSCSRDQPSHPILSGVANAAPIELSHLVGGRSSPHVELIDPFVFLFLVVDVVSNRGLISTHSRYVITACPEAQPRVILLLFPVYPSQGNRALALDESHHRRHGILRRNRDHHVYMVGQKMPFLDAAFFLLGQLSEYLAQMPAQVSIQHFASALGYENNMVLALPLRVA